MSKCEIPNDLIFYGEEIYIKDQYIKNISKILLKPIKRLSVEQALLTNISLISDDCLQVIDGFDDKLLGSNIRRIFLVDDIKGLSKDLNTTEFPKQSFEVCKIYATMKLKEEEIFVNEVDKSENTTHIYGFEIDELIKMCDCNLSFIMNEIDKVITIGQKSAKQLFEHLYQRGFTDYREINPFFIYQNILKGTVTLKQLDKLRTFSIMPMLVALKSMIISESVRNKKVSEYHSFLLKLLVDLDYRARYDSIIEQQAYEETCKLLFDYFCIKVVEYGLQVQAI